MRLRLGPVDINDNNVSEVTAMAEKVAIEENMSVERGGGREMGLCRRCGDV